MRRIPVAGGDLAVHELGGGDVTVVALHGITANGLTWLRLAGALDGTARVLAPDLRGRAASAGTTSPRGLGAHVDDLLAVLDAYGLENTVLIGHSMGAYVAALAGARHPDRFAGVVLVDGGVAFPPPPDLDIDARLVATIGPAMQRLSMTFASPAAYLDFWRPHPAVGPLLTGPTAHDVEQYLQHDLVRDGAEFRSSCVAEVIRADGADVLADPETHRAAAAATVPTSLLWAERGLLDQAPGLLTAESIEAAGLPSTVDLRFVPDVNHYSIIIGDAGVRTVAETVRRHLHR
ncbi:Pimeloyl-ACP methyl ester carboxylesterase [Nakamurella panacisegetis]|uniref:Pimeloyl-ACP methyl ester carboxylesterase n=1 Tax=Nakamurella panacisegetis TaxID=1090615 RepID=A0A1H0J327_9ACTN|nr:alpha/beta hydrolase [Nakamurella panacisegetis]SDO38002.1 Pimeloyl-ACP methyl ester carboxylesterase [Nakamurella panacisegetis]